MKQNKVKNKINLSFIGQYYSAVILVGVLVICGIFYFLIYVPVLADFNQFNQSEIINKENLLERQKSILSDLIKVNNWYKNTNQEYKKKISDILPTDYDVPNLYFNLEKIAENNNYKVSKIEINVLEETEKEKTKAEAATRAKTKEIDIKLNLKGGGYANLKKLIFDLENNLRILNISELKYSPEKTDLEIDLKTYYYN